MNVVKHTPGPWAVSRKDPHRVVVANGVEVNENQGDDVCVARASGDFFDDDNYDALAANARLIAAAPTMLVELRRLERFVSGGFTGCVSCHYVEGAGHRVGCKLEAAINAATGQS